MFPPSVRTAAHPKTVVSIIALAVALVTFGVMMLRAGGPRNAVALLASLFTTSRERIFFVGFPHPVAAGEILRLEWDREDIRRPGTFRFTYPCTGGIIFSFPNGETIPCNDGVVIAPVSPLEVVPVLDAIEPVTIFVSIRFVPDGADGAAVIGSTAVTLNPQVPEPIAEIPPEATLKPVLPRSGSLVPTPGRRRVSVYEFPAGSTTTSAVPPSPVPNGTADLAVSVVATGTVDASGNAFVPASEIQRGQQAAIMFDVMNRGKGTSAPWNFVVNLPTAESYLFRSGIQAALLPSEKIRFTIGFSDIRSGTTTAVITIDPDNSLQDANRQNDHASAAFYRSPN